MLEKIARVIVTAALLYLIAGCGAVEEASDEGGKAVQNGMAAADRADGIAEKKEAMQSDNDF